MLTRRAVLVLAVSGCAASLLFVGSAGAGTTSKPYSLVLSEPAGAVTYETVPGVVASGETVSVTATVRDDTTTQQLGSANVFWPAGFNVLDTHTYPVTSSAGTAAVSASCTDLGLPAGSCVELRNLSLSPGQSASVTMWVTTPACQAGQFAWSAEAKQANNFSGTPGNDLTYEAPPVSQPNTTLDGACALAFANQPSNTLVGQDIRNSAYDPTSDPVTVTVLDGQNPAQPLTTSTAPVTVALGGNNPANLQLAGTTTQPAAAGTASFGDLSLASSGNRLALTATSGTLTMGTISTAFAVTDDHVSCVTSCSSTDGTPDGNQAQVSAGASGDLTEAVNPPGQPALACTGSTLDPNTYQVFEQSSSDTVVTIKIVPPANLKGTPNQILKQAQICFGQATEFTTNTGTPAPAGTLPDGSPGYVGLLQTCTGSTTGPCHNRQADTTIPDHHTKLGYDLILVVDVPAAASSTAPPPPNTSLTTTSTTASCGWSGYWTWTWIPPPGHWYWTWVWTCTGGGYSVS
jgi:hypothetical protein